MINTSWKFKGDIGVNMVDSINVKFLNEGYFEYVKILNGKQIHDLVGGLNTHYTWSLDNSSLRLSFSKSDFTVLKGDIDFEKESIKGKKYTQGVEQGNWTAEKISSEVPEKEESNEAIELQVDQVFKSIFGENWKEEDYPEYGTLAYEIKNELFFEVNVSVQLADWIENYGYGCDRPNQIDENDETYDPNGNETIKIYADSYIDSNFKNNFLGSFDDEDYFNVELSKSELEEWIEKSIKSALDYFNNFSVASIEENDAPEDLLLDLPFNDSINLQEIKSKFTENNFIIKGYDLIPKRDFIF